MQEVKINLIHRLIGQLLVTPIKLACSLEKFKKITPLLALPILILSCASSGVKVSSVEVGEEIDGVSGVGLESHDIDSMTNKMIDEILSQKLPTNSNSVPKIIVDSHKMINESSQIINTSLLTDRIRIGLISNSNGQLIFISRENSDLVIEEAKLSNELNLIAADYGLTGRITSISGFSNKTGISSNFMQFTFELIDLKTSAIVWASFYDFKKTGADDTIYR
ncbi:MAG: hypothetical protein JJV97_01215 [SAR324 cluster bacterium]|nr:hypothetical protein [SAR324 cluster bacterium]